MLASVDDESPDARRLVSAERLRTFCDAVVAIAMTLLILPLMESIGNADSARGSGPWLSEHSDQLFSFALSFALITLFWINHYRLYEHVQWVDDRLVWLNAAWLLTIVWLPVATALSGRMTSTDATTKAVYVGSMISTSLLLLIQRVYLRQHPDLHHIDREYIRRGLSADVSVAVCFAAALVVMLAVPRWGYYPMLLMLLTGVIQRFIDRGEGVAN